jgi:short-subunit dehydrogenase
MASAVFLLARDEQRLAALQSELKRLHSVDIKFASFDFAAPDVFGRASAALAAVGIGSATRSTLLLQVLCLHILRRNVSVLVNNVGYLSDIPEPYLQHSREYVDRVISVRVLLRALLSNVISNRVFKPLSIQFSLCELPRLA